MADDDDQLPDARGEIESAESQERSGVFRRDVFRTSAMIAVGAALPACGKREEPRPAPPKPAPEPVLPTPPAAAAKAAAEEAAPAVELIELTFADLQARMKAGTDTSKSLVAKYRQRIEALDQKGPMLRAVLELNPDADAIAEKLDAERAAGKLRG
ncbi:MAG TPA: hypothetical protein VFD36_22105, partial [Kofleriaceae bacterium]|nr:hypothetical protein [Kofleriaceae bacterium]